MAIKLIKPLHIGQRTFTINLLAGPLAGTSCAAHRLLLWHHSKPAFVYSEMIAANALVCHHKITTRLLYRDPQEGPVCFQLFGNEATNLAEATKMATDAGADLIDLNCGCSVSKIRRSGSGAELLMDRKKLCKILTAMRSSTHLPLLVKIRVAIANEEINREIAQVIADTGVDCLVVHGRNWQESYATPCRYDTIKFFVDNLGIPVIGNGDVSCLASLRKMFATGCAGVMLARALVGQPWLIEKLTAQIEQRSFTEPTLEEIGKIFMDHVKHLEKLTQNERIAILQARKLAKGYTKQLKNRKDFCNAINTIDNWLDFCNLCEAHFRT